MKNWWFFAVVAIVLTACSGNGNKSGENGNIDSTTTEMVTDLAPEVKGEQLLEDIVGYIYRYKDKKTAEEYIFNFGPDHQMLLMYSRFHVESMQFKYLPEFLEDGSIVIKDVIIQETSDNINKGKASAFLHDPFVIKISDNHETMVVSKSVHETMNATYERISEDEL